VRDFYFYRKSAIWISLGQLGVILFCLWYVLLLLLDIVVLVTLASHCSIMPMNSLCPCLVCGFTCLSFNVLLLLLCFITYIRSCCFWTHCIPNNSYVRLWVTSLPRYYILRSTFATCFSCTHRLHTVNINQITPISFAPVPWPLYPRCPPLPTSDSWRRPLWLAIAPSAVDCVWLSTVSQSVKYD